VWSRVSDGSRLGSYHMSTKISSTTIILSRSGDEGARTKVPFWLALVCSS
jgi:hypothetical protein